MPKKNHKKKPIIIGNHLELKDQLNLISNEIPNEKPYETVLERLEREFPNAPFDIIEEIYEKNARSYLSSKKQLDEIFPNLENESKIPIEDINYNKNFNFDAIKDVKKSICINNFREAETNYTDENDKNSSKTEKSKNEKSDFSNELSKQFSGNHSNFSCGGKFLFK